jgi:hypothetical protein
VDSLSWVVGFGYQTTGTEAALSGIVETPERKRARRTSGMADIEKAETIKVF